MNAELGELQAVQFGSRAVVALIADFPAGTELARRSSNRLLASTSVGHLIFRDAPQPVIATTRLAVAAVRNGTMRPSLRAANAPRRRTRRRAGRSGYRPRSLEQRPPLPPTAPRIAGEVVSVDARQVERDERERDRGLPAQHSLDEKRPVRRHEVDRSTGSRLRP